MGEGLLVFLAIVYVAPIFFAFGRQHQNAGAITALTLLAGWTFIGWMIALIWSLTATKRAPGASHPAGGVAAGDGEGAASSSDAPGGGGDVISAVERLSALREKGAITPEEFERLKADALSRPDAATGAPSPRL